MGSIITILSLHLESLTAFETLLSLSFQLQKAWIIKGDAEWSTTLPRDLSGEPLILLDIHNQKESLELIIYTLFYP
jgi:hypothetical protein